MALRRLHCTVGATAALLGVLLGACGSSAPSPTFTREFRSQEAELTRVSSQLRSVIRRASQVTDLQLARQLKPLATRSDEVVKRLETLQPPSSLSTDFDALRNALNRRVTDLHAIVQGLKAHDASFARSATQSLIVDSASAVSAQRRLDSKLG
jgi:hypothetical protein